MHLFPFAKRGAALLRRNILTALCSALIVGCASTGNNFDEGKLTQIKTGETTEVQLLEMFGQPQNRTVNSEGVATLTWMYAEATVSGQAFIPYAGAFMKHGEGKSKSLSVTVANNLVTGYTYSGSQNESRGSTQSTPKS